MKKHLPILFVLLFAASCAKLPAASETLSESSLSESITPSSETEKPSSSETEKPSSSESSETGTTTYDISEIKEIGSAYAALVDDDGFYVSDVLVEFQAQLLMVEDYTSATGVKPQHTAFVANATGFISIYIDSQNAYKELKKYVLEQQVYLIKGYIGYFDGQVGVDTRKVGKPQYLSTVTPDYDYRKLAINGKTITDLVSRVNMQKFNVKGISASANLYKYTLKYLMKVENTIGLFTDGVQIIMVHGHDKMNNVFDANLVYDIYGREGYHQFRPQIKFISATKNTSAGIDFDFKSNAEEISATKLYTYKYEKDEKAYIASNKEYASLFVKVFKFSGYVNYYQKGGNYSYCLDDNDKSSSYGTVESAYRAKTLFLNNNGYVNETGPEIAARDLFLYSPSGAEAGTKIDLYFAAYMWNTNNYWQVQLFLDSIPKPQQN